MKLLTPTLFLCLGLSLLKAQNNGQVFFVDLINDPDPDTLVQLLQQNFGQNVRIERTIFNANIPLGGVSFTLLDPSQLPEIRQLLIDNYGDDGFIFDLDRPVTPQSGGNGAADGSLPEVNPALDFILNEAPSEIPAPKLGGKIIVEIVGTGVDVIHEELCEVSFEPYLSRMAASTGGFLPGNKDHHNHETSTAACLVGSNTGLLTSLGIRDHAQYRPVLCYPKNTGTGPFTTVSACVDAIDFIVEEYELRTETPYLKNHASVILFPHTVETINTRVRAMDIAVDHAWEKGIVVCLSGGNSADVAAAVSPAGAGEWVVYLDGGNVEATRYWPIPGPSATYTLPGTVSAGTIAFGPEDEGGDYHLKAGAHDSNSSPAPWSAGVGVGSNLNNANPAALLGGNNRGIDLFLPGENVPVPTTTLTLNPTGSEVIDGCNFSLSRSYAQRDGTSYSAAFLAAAATYVLQQKPWATPEQVRELLVDTSNVIDDNVSSLRLPTPSEIDSLHLTYPQWINRYQALDDLTIPDTAAKALTADPDGDGVINMIEYLCGFDPRFTDTNLEDHLPKLTVSQTAGSNIQTVATMQLADYLHTGSQGVKWEIQSSPDLVTWSTVPKGTLTSAPVTSDNGDGCDITRTRTFAPPADHQFYRIRILSVP